MELERVGTMIFELTGQQPNLFRTPFGKYGDKVIRTAARSGCRTVQQR